MRSEFQGFGEDDTRNLENSFRNVDEQLLIVVLEEVKGFMIDSFSDPWVEDLLQQIILNELSV